MPLILAPSFDEHTIQQVEEHVAAVQARRMVAAMEYHAGKNADLRHESDKIQRKIDHQYTMLGKEITALNNAEHKVEMRLEALQNLKNEIGLVVDMIELHGVPTEMEDE